MPGSFPDRERTLGSLLRQAYGLLQTRTYAALGARGFSDLRAAHSAVFRHIEPEGSRVTDLAAQAGMAKQSMSYLIEALARSGYLSMVPDPVDGRAKLARLTRRGHEAMAALIALSAQFERELGRKMGVAKSRQLRALLEDATAAMQPGTHRPVAGPR